MNGECDQISIHSSSVQTGVDVVHAQFKKFAFTPHRHDEYVVGVTRHGEQKFRYRGVEQRAIAGHAFIIHPDELHDGRPGTSEGYSYRALYLRPALVSAALGQRPLPFVSDVVSNNVSVRRVIEQILLSPANCDDDLESTERISMLADMLSDLSGQSNSRAADLDVNMLERIKEQLESKPANRVSMKSLEAEYGVNRFSITRQFKRYLGTSPHRYLIMRRLELAKKKLQTGNSIADAAIESGFADQSHLTRWFRQAFGITPKNWVRISRVAVCTQVTKVLRDSQNG